MKRVIAASLVVGCAIACAGVAAAEPVGPHTPSLGQVFNGYVVGAVLGGRIASPGELVTPLLSTDPFYDEPRLTGKEAPGTIVKSLPVAVQFSGLRPADLDAYKLMYVTTGLDGRREISTGILMIPRDGKNNANRRIVGYSEANDSVGAYCHPSTQWTGGAQLDAAAWSALGPLAQMFGRGYAVMITDVGNNGDPRPHGVFAGKFGGTTALDGLRAALSLRQAGLNKKAPISLFGIAGGGVGAGFAAELQPTYAPELNVKSAVLEGMVVDQRNFLRAADGSIGSGFGFATLLGLEPRYPEMRINEKLNPVGRAIADVYRTQCQTPAYFTLPFVPLPALFNGGQGPADIPDFQPAFRDNLLGGRAPKAKVLIASCRADDSPMSLVPAKDSRDLAATYRRGGTRVDYQPTDCSMLRFLTDLYGWGTDLFGMQTVDWLAATLK